ncbi:hypothetical protein GYMLUDRAFT_343030 [Collybiopsis luxurians FD-317 M1]|nr:hypothetical protein GYMLUDRAFT_343030 [Collybiopsis luxurians FD-317 M1]
MTSPTPNPAPAITAEIAGVVSPTTGEITRIWQEAINKFQQKNNISALVWKQALRDMNDCDSVEGICDVLEKQFFTKIKAARGGQKWQNLREKYLEPVVNFVIKFSDILRDIVGSIVCFLRACCYLPAFEKCL